MENYKKLAEADNENLLPGISKATSSNLNEPSKKDMYPLSKLPLPGSGSLNISNSNGNIVPHPFTTAFNNSLEKSQLEHAKYAGSFISPPKTIDSKNPKESSWIEEPLNLTKRPDNKDQDVIYNNSFTPYEHKKNVNKTDFMNKKLKTILQITQKEMSTFTLKIRESYKQFIIDNELIPNQIWVSTDLVVVFTGLPYGVLDLIKDYSPQIDLNEPVWDYTFILFLMSLYDTDMKNNEEFTMNISGSDRNYTFKLIN